MPSCYGCKFLIQGGDGECGCLKFHEANYEMEARHLSDPPGPLYEDCYQGSATERREGA